MPIWSQHLLVLVATIACVAFIARGAIRSLAGRKSQLGNCGTCSGCATTPQSNPAQQPPRGERIAIIPVEMLISRRKQN